VLIRAAKLDAQGKAIDALGRYKFMMFGYWAAIWVYLNKLDDNKESNPFTFLVHEARKFNTKGNKRILEGGQE